MVGVAVMVFPCRHIISQPHFFVQTFSALPVGAACVIFMERKKRMNNQNVSYISMYSLLTYP